ncbi:MAG: NTP transferase domain-containing protein [Verrucomicrobiia bacterium]
MNAFIYAAGAGRRLGPELGRKPKILLEIGGRTLLEWHACRLREAGISQVFVVIGFKAELVCSQCADLEAKYGLSLRPILNPDFTEGSVLSFEVSLSQLRQQTEPVLVMDGDVLYPAALLRRLIHSPHRTALLLDRAYSTADDDPVLVPVQDGRPFEFKKGWTGQTDLVGESIGFFKIDPVDLPALEQATRRRTAGNRRTESYDEVLRDMVTEGRFGYEDVTGTPWSELDFPGDVEYATNHVLPLIQAQDPVAQPEPER